MARKKRRRIRGVSNDTLLIIGGVVALGTVIWAVNSSKPATTTIVARPTATGPATTTAAEVAAGATVATSLINALSDSGDDSDS